MSNENDPWLLFKATHTACTAWCTMLILKLFPCLFERGFPHLFGILHIYLEDEGVSTDEKKNLLTKQWQASLNQTGPSSASCCPFFYCLPVQRVSLKKVSYEAWVFSVFSRNQEKPKPGSQSAQGLCDCCNLGTALLPMPVSPSGVSGISAFPFRTCRSLDELWIFQVRPATFKNGRALKSETTKTPSMLQAAGMLILSNPFLEFCLSTPAFSSIILIHMFVQAFDTLKTPEHRFGTRNTLNKVIWLSVSLARFLLLCQFYMNMNLQFSWPHWLSTYCWQLSTCNHFHVKWSINPRVTSIFPTAIISSCALPGRFQLRCYFSKFPSRFSVC